MNAKRRKESTMNLEPNLYKNGPYYRYKHPIAGTWHQMGKDVYDANVAARTLNETLSTTKDLYRDVLNLDKFTFSATLARYKKEYLPHKGLKPNTLSIVKYRLSRLDKDLGETPICKLSVEALSTYLDSAFKGDPYIKHRGALIDIFKWAITKGIVEENPASKTLSKAASKKKRSPLSLEDFHSIRANAPDWLKIAMDLAIVSLQRRGDLCELKYDDIRDGRMFIIQQKTEKHGVRARLSIEYSAQLEAIVKASRLDQVATPYIIHTRPKRIIKSETKTHWCQVLPDYLSKQFAIARDKIDKFATMPSLQKPTFHEIRALGGWLYLESGHSKEYVNLLMGHTTMSMTEHYTDRHIEYTECRAELVIH